MRTNSVFSAAGVQKQRTPDPTTKPEVTYARPLQQHKLQKQLNKSQQSSSGAASPRIPVSVTGDGPSQQPSPLAATDVDAKPGCSDPNSPLAVDGQQQRRLCRPNVLALVKNFDADRPLPAPPRSSDTAAGRPRHHDSRRRRRGQHHDQPPQPAAKPLQKEQLQLHFRGGPAQAAWPSSFRSPVPSSVQSSRPSSLSSSESTDAGNTTASNNNYNTTTTATSTSSSDESFDLGAGVHRAVQDVEDFDTAASSAAVSPIHHHYRQQLLRQWSPSTTANSSPVRRSSSFRSPVSGGDVTGPSSSSLRSPPGQAAGCTQSLNRRHMRPTNTAGAGSSGRRRRRRQQPQNNASATAAGQPISPPTGAVVDALADAQASSSWVKQLQQQHQKRSGKDQGTGGGSVTSPDFTDEICRMLDHHRGNVRQEQRGPINDGQVEAVPTDRQQPDGGKE